MSSGPSRLISVLERLAFDVLEHDERSAGVGVMPVVRGLLAGVDHRHDVRMAELRDRARLAAKALELVGVGGDLAMHQLDRDWAFEHDVKGAIDGRHAASPDLGVEAIAPAEQGPEDGHRVLLCVLAQASEHERREQAAVERVGQQGVRAPAAAQRARH